MYTPAENLPGGLPDRWALRENCMFYEFHRKLFLATCCIFALVSSVNAKDYKMVASRLFEQRFTEQKIEGTGHMFSIVVECDSQRLKEISDHLSGDNMQVVEYDFGFEIYTKQKFRSRIMGGVLNKLSKAVEACIIERYRKDVTFMPYAPTVIEERVRFPVVLYRGRQPLFPRTPIGFVSEEK